MKVWSTVVNLPTLAFGVKQAWRQESFDFVSDLFLQALRIHATWQCRNGPSAGVCMLVCFTDLVAWIRRICAYRLLPVLPRHRGASATVAKFL